MNFTIHDRSKIEHISQKYAINRFNNFLYYVHSAGHSISWGTNAGMFSYLPANIKKMNEAAGPNAYMGQANGVMIWNTLEMKHEIFKWALLCALTKYCIAPETVWRLEDRVYKWCPKGKETIGHDYVCHRYDQSMFGILVRNFYGYDESRYQVPDEELIGRPERLG